MQLVKFLIGCLQENSNGNPVSSSSNGRVGSSSGGEGSETVGETQEEEPSSSSSHPQHAKTELDNFRLQWKREIERSPDKKTSYKERVSSLEMAINDADTLEEKVSFLLSQNILTLINSLSSEKKIVTW